MSNYSIKILVLGRKSITTQIIVHFLREQYHITWVAESRDDHYELVKKRIRKMGLLVVLSQFIFIIYSKILRILSKKRIRELSYFLEKKKIKPNQYVVNVNNYWEYLDPKRMKFDIIIISGTRIINSDFLSILSSVPIVNIHTGIVPMYRGVHGGYWSLATNDSKNFGATIHHVDTGVDTGLVIKKIFLNATKKDNFCTYPVLQVTEAAKVLVLEVPNIIENKLNYTNERISTSFKLWSHPTLCQYLSNYWKYKIK